MPRCPAAPLSDLTHDIREALSSHCFNPHQVKQSQRTTTSITSFIFFHHEKTPPQRRLDAEMLNRFSTGSSNHRITASRGPTTPNHDHHHVSTTSRLWRRPSSPGSPARRSRGSSPAIPPAHACNATSRRAEDEEDETPVGRRGRRVGMFWG